MKVSLAERIRLGVAFIKGAYGWEALETINAETLALRDGTSCVLGQLGGDYARETTRLKLSREMAYTYGFNVKEGMSYSKENRAFSALDRAWKKEINKTI